MKHSKLFKTSNGTLLLFDSKQFSDNFMHLSLIVFDVCCGFASLFNYTSRSFMKAVCLCEKHILFHGFKPVPDNMQKGLFGLSLSGTGLCHCSELVYTVTLLHCK